VASLEREVALPGARPMLLDTRTKHTIAPATTCDEIQPLPSLVTIAGAIELAGTPLDQDDRVVAIDAASELLLTWAAATTGRWTSIGSCCTR